MKRIISSMLREIILAVSLPITAYADCRSVKETVIDELFDKRVHIMIE